MSIEGIDVDLQLYPSYLIATATIPSDGPIEDLSNDILMLADDEFGAIGVWVGPCNKGDKFKLRIKENSLAEETVYQVTAKESATEALLVPKMNWKFEALGKVTQQRPANFILDLEVNGESLGSKTVTVRLNSVNDCPFLVDPGEDDPYQDLSWMFAAYVNENHPWVDKLLKEALDAKAVDSFTGYQSGDPEVVIQQVFAIWNALQARGVKYSDITTSAAHSELVFSQHVRLFDEAVEAKQANCVDGACIFAAALRKIGLETWLVLVPGHMYVAFAADPNDEEILGLETTLLGSQDLDEIKVKPRAKGADPTAALRELKLAVSGDSFLGAIDAGTAGLIENGEKFDSEDEGDFQLINIREAREFGILPIAFDGE